MKATFVVILIGFWALPHGQSTCVFPFLCNTKNGIPGRLMCPLFCATVGATGGTCTGENWPSVPAKCICKVETYIFIFMLLLMFYVLYSGTGPRKANIVTDFFLTVYENVSVPSVCSTACVACDLSKKSVKPYIEDTDTNVAVVCKCQ